MSKFTAADFTHEEMIDLFDQQMLVVERSLLVSFNKYSIRKQEAIEAFSNFFNVPRQVFEDHVSQELWKQLSKGGLSKFVYEPLPSI